MVMDPREDLEGFKKMQGEPEILNLTVKKHVPELNNNLTRPFKKFPILDPTAMTYRQFREIIISQTKNCNSTNENMRRMPKTKHQDIQDPDYLEKRKKNNEAAKKSRDARKLKEDEMALRCAFLEHENMNLKIKLQYLEQESERLGSLVETFKV